jgi:hypothetical protein
MCSLFNTFQLGARSRNESSVPQFSGSGLLGEPPMGRRCGTSKLTSDMRSSASALPRRCRESSASLCWPSPRLGARLHGKRSGGPDHPASEAPWWPRSLVGVVRSTHRLRQFSPLPRQIQPLIAKLAIGDGGRCAFAFLRPFKGNLHPPFHQATTSVAGFCSVSDIGWSDQTATHRGVIEWKPAGVHCGAVGITAAARSQHGAATKSSRRAPTGT